MRVASLIPRVGCLLILGCGRAAQPTHEGRYVFGHEVRTFQPCGGATIYWVLGAEETTLALRAVHDSLTDRPYDPVYVRVRGAVVPGRGDGFAESYDGLFRIDTVLTVLARIPATCTAPPAPADTSGASPGSSE